MHNPSENRFRNLIQFLFRKPEEIGFDNYMILVITFMIMSIGVLGSITNIALGLNKMTTISTITVTFIFVLIYSYSRI